MGVASQDFPRVAPWMSADIDYMCMQGLKCEHGRTLAQCHACKQAGREGGSICEHSCHRSKCVTCKRSGQGGGSLCKHNLVKRDRNEEVCRASRRSYFRTERVQRLIWKQVHPMMNYEAKPEMPAAPVLPQPVQQAFLDSSAGNPAAGSDAADISAT